MLTASNVSQNNAVAVSNGMTNAQDRHDGEHQVDDPDVPVPRELAHPGGWQLDHNRGPVIPSFYGSGFEVPRSGMQHDYNMYGPYSDDASYYRSLYQYPEFVDQYAPRSTHPEQAQYPLPSQNAGAGYYQPKSGAQDSWNDLSPGFLISTAGRKSLHQDPWFPHPRLVPGGEHSGPQFPPSPQALSDKTGPNTRFKQVHTDHFDYNNYLPSYRAVSEPAASVNAFSSNSAAGTSTAEAFNPI